MSRGLADLVTQAPAEGDEQAAPLPPRSPPQATTSQVVVEEREDDLKPLCRCMPWPPAAPRKHDPKLAAVVPEATAGDPKAAVVAAPQPQANRGQEARPRRSLPTPQATSSRSNVKIGEGQLGPQTGVNIGRKTLVLDLDETLVHSSFQPVYGDNIIVITVELEEGELHQVYVRKRPYVDEFLVEVAKLYEVVVYTASMAMYANPLLDRLDTRKTVSFRLFRQACTRRPNGYTKDLSLLGRDLKNVIIVDNSPICYSLQPYNAIPISTWRTDPNDQELYDLIAILGAMVHVDDIPTVLKSTVWALDDDTRASPERRRTSSDS